MTFYENDYAAHTTCISEAEKYEKSLYKAKPGANKPKAQDIWTALIEDIVAESSQAPPSVRPFLERLSSLSNVPRNKKKFINFSRNSLNIRSDAVLEDMWNFLEKVRVQKEGATAAPVAAAPSSSSTSAAAAPEETQLPTETTEEKKSKKDKKRKHDDDEVEPEASSKKSKLTEESTGLVSETVEEDSEKKSKKDKKKKDKKEKKDKKDSK